MSSENLKKIETDNKIFKNKVFTEDLPRKDSETSDIDEIKAIKNKQNKYPKIVFFIIANEFCERFSYYGLKTVLYIFLTGFLKVGKDSATAIYHAFAMICYFTPAFGAIIADGYLGLYSTILYVSCVYFVGELVLALTSLKPLGAPNLAGPLIGLMIIAIGTGGIKPCVSAFGGNQFLPTQTRYIETFFSVFYLSINIGSTIGTILAPIFRSDIKCFDDDCYPLAFGIPAALMFVAIIFFVIGTPYYKRDDPKSRNSKNIIKETICCTIRAIRNKIKMHKSFKKNNWLDYADDKYSIEMISDVKAFFKVLVVFLPLPIFWALYDQQGSRWTSQAQQLNGRIGSITIKPDQFQAVNPIFIVMLVPLFDIFVYPIFSKCNLLKKQLQRMCVGLLLGILAFVIAAVLEAKMQAASQSLNPQNQLRIVNLSPCDISIVDNSQTVLEMNSYKYQNNSIYKYQLNDQYHFLTYQSKCINKIFNKSLTFKLEKENLPKTIIFYYKNDDLKFIDYLYDTSNQPIGSSELQVLNFELFNDYLRRVSLVNSIIKYDFDKYRIKNFNEGNFNKTFKNESDYRTLDYGNYVLKFFDNSNEKLIEQDILIESCARYTILVFDNIYNESAIDYIVLTDIYPNGIHLGWQLIQIFVMTIAEIMFSISGLSFAYSQAPTSMKSVMQALWCMTIAVGNLVVVIVAESKFIDNQVHEYFIFAGMLALATIVFMILSYFYVYEENEISKSDLTDKDESKNSSDKSDDLNSPKVLFKKTKSDISTNKNIQLIRISALDTQ